MRTAFISSLLAILLALTGCVADNGLKPAEDNVPLDGKADSFRNPTEHGALIFETAMRGSLNDDEHFHAWMFELAGEATLELDVDSPGRNLDTVMYLYRRDSEDDRWGRYIARNDDDGDELTSAIRGDYEAGLYRIIVKGYKRQHQGPFSITGLCAGDGCRVAPDPGGVVVPAETGFSTGCVDRLWTALGSPVVSSSGFAIEPDAASGHEPAVLVATAHYADLSDWREYVYDDEEFTFDVDYIELENGFVVEMADGGDESTTDYAFDAEGNLLAYYVHNQSPWTGYFCALEADEAADEPTEDCLSAWMNHAPRAAGSVVDGTETYDPELPNDEITSVMAAAIRAYTADVLEGAEAVIRIEFTAWTSPDEGNGAELLLSSGDEPMVSYSVIDNGWDDEPWVVFSSNENDDDGMQMVCTR